MHLFVAYDIPITTPYQIVHSIQRAASSASSAATSATSAVSEFVESPTVAASLVGLLKRFLLNAAGEQGVAERVDVDDQIGLLPDALQQDSLAHVPHQVSEKIERWVEQRFETHYRTDWTRVNCIDTSGEAFAIYLNLLYLAPLTWLFARFFIKTYTQRGKAGRRRRASVALHDAAESLREARKSTESAVEDAGERGEEEALRRQEELKEDIKAVKEGKYGGLDTPQRRVSERVQSFEGKMKDFAERTKEEAKRLVGSGSGRSSRRSSPSKPAQEGEKEGEGNKTGQDQPTAAQNENSADSQASGAEPEEPSKEDSANAAADAIADDDKDTDGDGEGENKENEPPKDSNAEPEAKQDNNSAESQATRPAPGDEDTSSPATDEGSGEKKDDDTDEMGNSGAIIDHPEEGADGAEEGKGGNDEGKGSG